MTSDDGTGYPRYGFVNRLKRPFRSKRPDDACQKWRDEMQARLHTLQGRRIPEYEAAILSCSVTLQQIIEARYMLHEGGHVNEIDSLILYEELLWRTYQHAHGTITEYYFSVDRRAAAVLIKPRDRRAMDIDFFYRSMSLPN
jgi:hypothetical protein